MCKWLRPSNSKGLAHCALTWTLALLLAQCCQGALCCRPGLHWSPHLSGGHVAEGPGAAQQ